MVREACEKDLREILELYLDLHERAVPEKSEQLRRTWEKIMSDEDHHLIVYDLNGKIVSSCVCAVIPNLTRGYALMPLWKIWLPITTIGERVTLPPA